MIDDDATNRAVLVNFITVVFFFVLIATFIWYVNKNEPNVQKVALMNAADKFNNLVTAAHWHWRSKGEPERIVLVDYDLVTQKEVNQLSVSMSESGWPRIAPDTQGCKAVWQMLLDIPLQIETFKVRVTFFDGIHTSGKILDSKCQFKVTAGAWFDYYIYTGRVDKSE